MSLKLLGISPFFGYWLILFSKFDNVQICIQHPAIRQLASFTTRGSEIGFEFFYFVLLILKSFLLFLKSFIKMFFLFLDSFLKQFLLVFNETLEFIR